MNREDLKRYLGTSGYSLGQVEKDYFQHIILSRISRKIGTKLVFKGGTALQKTGKISRFSEDLDFTAVDSITADNLRELVRNSIESYGYDVELDKETDDERTIGIRAKIYGPLYRKGVGICSVKIDISRREKVLLSPENTILNPPYPDILPYPIYVMKKEEMAAEKVRAIMTRNMARDVYDIYILLQHGVELIPSLIERKMKYYEMNFDFRDFERQVERSTYRWERELSPLLRDVPSKEEALALVSSALKQV